MTPYPSQSQPGGYHHGDLRNALLSAVGEIVRDKGIGGVSLREAARRAGVSHGAPAHHFGDKLGMLTAFSIEGFELFGERMRAAVGQATEPSDRLTALGLEYLRFAIEERAYFEVMFRSEMHSPNDPGLSDAAANTFSVLFNIAEDLTGQDEYATVLALKSWATVHGLATLWLDGAMANKWDGDDIYELALRIFETEPN